MDAEYVCPHCETPRDEGISPEDCCAWAEAEALRRKLDRYWDLCRSISMMSYDHSVDVPHSSARVIPRSSYEEAVRLWKAERP